MPATVNGIGTHYYGKSNKSSRTGVCRACGATCRLESYDTRLWLVVFYIPIIPLGRKRITDQCSRCRRHWVADKAVYEASKRENITAAMEQYEKQPTPESALDLHGSLLAFHQFGKAKDFRALAMKQHRDSDALFQGLAAQMEQVGQAFEKEPFYEQAYALRPDLPEIGFGVADARIADGRLDEARRLLKPLETPVDAQNYSLGRVEMLARAYQRAGRHAETLEICKHLLSELPQIGEIREFRQLVSASEKALDQPESMLPKQSVSVGGLLGRLFGAQTGWRGKAAIGVAVLLIVAVVLLGSNEYIRRHRHVYAINDIGQPVKMSIDGEPLFDVGVQTPLDLAEGRHHVKISGSVNDEFDVDMHSDYFARWTKSPVWVIGVGGGAALFVNTLHYAVHPPPSQTQLVLVDRLFYLPDVDYAFTTPPQKIDLGGDRDVRTKIHLERANTSAANIFNAALQRGDPAAWPFAEARLRGNPADSALLTAYEYAAVTSGQLDRAREFFQTGLARRPISVEWHRAYQDLGRNGPREAELIAEYDKLLKQEPHSAALLYLRGRIDGDSVKARDFFHKSCAADAKCPWPWMALAYDAACRGDWRQARELADKAFKLHLDNQSLQEVRFAARLATGDYAAMEKELRRILESTPPEDHVSQLIELCEVLAAEGKRDEAQKVLTDWEKQIPPMPQSTEIVSACRQYVWYIIGAEVMRDTANSPPSIAASHFRLHTLLAQGRPQEAVKDPASQQSLEDPWNALAVGVAFGIASNQAGAAAWREKACAAMEKLDADSRHAAAFLRAEKPPTKSQFNNLVLEPSLKALLAAALAQHFPKQKAEFLAIARRLNVRRMPPYQLVRKATE